MDLRTRIDEIARFTDIYSPEWKYKFEELRRELQKKAYQSSVWQTGRAQVIVFAIAFSLIGASVVLGGFNNAAAALAGGFNNVADYLRNFVPPSQNIGDGGSNNPSVDCSKYHNSSQCQKNGDGGSNIPSVDHRKYPNSSQSLIKRQLPPFNEPLNNGSPPPKVS